MLQHYHFDFTCIIHYIDPKGIIFKVDRDVSREVSKIVHRIEKNRNLALVFSNPALGEIFTKYIEIISTNNIQKRISEIDYVKPIDNFINLKSRLKERLILGFYGYFNLINMFTSAFKRIDEHLSDVDRLILANAALDTSATKFYTTDRKIIYSSSKLISLIIELRKEHFNIKRRLDITSP